MSKILYLGLGSNMGNRSHFLQQAAQWIQIKIGAITKNSRIYETAAWGNANQQAFYNQVLEVTTTMSPAKTLETCLEIEQLLGRQRGPIWGPRTIDIDILWYDGQVLQLANLNIPHPYLHLRRFVLVPFVEIAPHIIHPTLGINIQQLLDLCPDNLETTSI